MSKEDDIREIYDEETKRGDRRKGGIEDDMKVVKKEWIKECDEEAIDPAGNVWTIKDGFLDVYEANYKISVEQIFERIDNFLNESDDGLAENRVSQKEFLRILSKKELMAYSLQYIRAANLDVNSDIPWTMEQLKNTRRIVREKLKRFLECYWTKRMYIEAEYGNIGLEVIKLKFKGLNREEIAKKLNITVYRVKEINKWFKDNCEDI